jgi:hypothetical protein
MTYKDAIVPSTICDNKSKNTVIALIFFCAVTALCMLRISEKYMYIFTDLFFPHNTCAIAKQRASCEALIDV